MYINLKNYTHIIINFIVYKNSFIKIIKGKINKKIILIYKIKKKNIILIYNIKKKKIIKKIKKKINKKIILIYKVKKKNMILIYNIKKKEIINNPRFIRNFLFYFPKHLPKF